MISRFGVDFVVVGVVVVGVAVRPCGVVARLVAEATIAIFKKEVQQNDSYGRPRNTVHHLHLQYVNRRLSVDYWLGHCPQMQQYPFRDCNC